MQQKEGGMPRGPPVILAENGANAIPTWIPKWSQDGKKNDAFWDRFVVGF